MVSHSFCSFSVRAEHADSSAKKSVDLAKNGICAFLHAATKHTSKSMARRVGMKRSAAAGVLDAGLGVLAGVLCGVLQMLVRAVDMVAAVGDAQTKRWQKQEAKMSGLFCKDQDFRFLLLRMGCLQVAF